MYSDSVSRFPKFLQLDTNYLGGSAAVEKVRSNPLLMVLAIIVIIVIIVLIIFGIWSAMYAKQKKEEQNCTPAHGCLLLRGVKNGNDKLQISSDHLPTQTTGSSYTVSVWLYAKDRNFDGSKQWSGVLFRGGVPGQQPDPDDSHVQPGIWLQGGTNRLLFRWETAGRFSTKPCCQMPGGCTKANNGQGCHDDDGVKKWCHCAPDGTSCAWSQKVDDSDTSNYWSANPWKNPPNPQCTGTIVRGQDISNSSKVNTENEACVSNIPVNRWFLVTMVMHSHSAEIYIDGKIVVTQPLNSSPVIHPESPFNLCTDINPGGGVNGFYGAITQLRYFAVALNPYDVLKIYSWGPHPMETEDPNKLKKELSSLTGSVSASVQWSNSNQDSQGVNYGF